MQAQHMLVPVVMLLAATIAQAQQAPQGAEHASHPVHATASAPKAPMSTGEVRKVDVAQAKVTLRLADPGHWPPTGAAVTLAHRSLRGM